MGDINIDEVTGYQYEVGDINIDEVTGYQYEVGETHASLFRIFLSGCRASLTTTASTLSVCRERVGRCSSAWHNT